MPHDWTERQRERDDADLARRLEALRLPAVPVRRHASLSLPVPLGAGWSWTAAAVGIGARDDAVALWRRRDGTPGAIVQHVSPGSADTADVRVLPSVVDRVVGVQPLSGGRTALLVEDPLEGDPSKRASTLHVIDADGRQVASADAGPDTCALIATTDDALWVGYSDIGHYANHPLAWQGLARFDASLVETTSHRVSDLALLNVTDNVVHAAGYACTELLRITKK